MHRLLIVPDDLLQLELHASYLDRRGIHSRSALSAEEALAIAMVWRPALVVFGSVLAGMTTATFVDRLRAASPPPGPQLIMITTSIEDASATPETSFYDAHLVAPVDPSQLLATAAALLDIRQRRTPRIKISLAVTLVGLSNDPTGSLTTPAVTVDLSEGGMRVEPRDTLAVGMTGTVSLVLPGSQARLVLPCTVRALVDEMLFHYGLEFPNLTDEQRSLIRAFVELRTSQWERVR